MKKARIMLSAIAVLAVIGGAFAFKATRVPRTFYHKTTATGLCTVPVAMFYSTTTVGGTIVPYSTTPTNLTLCSARILLTD